MSDGAANSSSAVQAQTLMRAALDNNNFTCPTSGGLRNLDESNKSKVSAWNCMGELAKYLFSGNNPQSAQIRTAFVGFGTAFAGLDKDYVQEACKLASRTQPDRKGMTLAHLIRTPSIRYNILVMEMVYTMKRVVPMR